MGDWATYNDRRLKRKMKGRYIKYGRTSTAQRRKGSIQVTEWVENVEECSN
jgi:hypothetical protein